MQNIKDWATLANTPPQILQRIPGVSTEVKNSLQRIPEVNAQMPNTLPWILKGFAKNPIKEPETQVADLQQMIFTSGWATQAPSSELSISLRHSKKYC